MRGQSEHGGLNGVDQAPQGGEHRQDLKGRRSCHDRMQGHQDPAPHGAGRHRQHGRPGADARNHQAAGNRADDTAEVERQNASTREGPEARTGQHGRHPVEVRVHGEQAGKEGGPQRQRVATEAGLEEHTDGGS